MNDAPSPTLHGLSYDTGELIRAPCPQCRSGSSVTDTRPWHGGIKRRRECKQCRHRWTTIEVPYELAEQLPDIEAELRGTSRRMGEMARSLAAFVSPEGER